VTVVLQTAVILDCNDVPIYKAECQYVSECFLLFLFNALNSDTKAIKYSKTSWETPFIAIFILRSVSPPGGTGVSVILASVATVQWNEKFVQCWLYARLLSAYLSLASLKRLSIIIVDRFIDYFTVCACWFFCSRNCRI